MFVIDSADMGQLDTARDTLMATLQNTTLKVCIGMHIRWKEAMVCSRLSALAVYPAPVGVPWRKRKNA